MLNSHIKEIHVLQFTGLYWKNRTILVVHQMDRCTPFPANTLPDNFHSWPGILLTMTNIALMLIIIIIIIITQLFYINSGSISFNRRNSVLFITLRVTISMSKSCHLYHNNKIIFFSLQDKIELKLITQTLMKYVKYVEHQYMHEQYYSEIEMSTSSLLDKYQTLLRQMMSLLCICRQKMIEKDLKMEASVINEVNNITYETPINKMLMAYESLVVINTYLNDFLAHNQQFFSRKQI